MARFNEERAHSLRRSDTNIGVFSTLITLCYPDSTSSLLIYVTKPWESRNQRQKTYGWRSKDVISPWEKLQNFMQICNICMCMSASPACVYVNHITAWHLLRLEEGVRSLGTGVIEGCELWVLGIEPGAAARTSTLKTPSQLSSSNFIFFF